MWRMACYCYSYSDGAYNECESKEWVDEWCMRPLIPLETYRRPSALQLTQMEASIDFDHVSDLVQPGKLSTCNFLYFNILP